MDIKYFTQQKEWNKKDNWVKITTFVDFLLNK